jgi:hypothetical protein
LKRCKLLPAAGLSLAAFFVFAACAGIPKSPDPVSTEAEYLPLDAGARVYLVLDVKGARPLLDQMDFKEMDGSRAKQVLDMTSSAVAAVYPGGERRFQAAAWGKFPAFRAGLSFAFSRDWKKLKSRTGASYWRSEKEGLSLFLNGKRAWASDGDPFAPPPGVEIPRGFSEFSRGSVLACWLPEPSALMDRFLADLGLPLRIPAESLFAGLVPSDSGEGYEALIRIETPSASQAGALASIINIARMHLFRAGGEFQNAELAGKIFANPPSADGAYLSLRTAAFSGKELALLFSRFPVYF